MLLFVLAVCACPRLYANGRFPQAMQLAENPNDADRLWLKTTYGLLTSGDGGKSWRWICEEAMGFSSSSPFDPMLVVHADGSLLIGLLDGVRTSRDEGCTWKSPAPELRGKFVLDLAVDARDRNRALGLVSFGKGVDGGVRYTNEIWETIDAGKSFELLTNELPSNAYCTTLDVAPSDPKRLYLSMHVVSPGKPAVPALLRSNDRGKTWKKLALPVREASVFIGAVHPTNPDIVYVRTQARVSDTESTSALLYTADGGRTWRQVLEQKAPMLGFALSGNGEHVFAGFGDPGDRGGRLKGDAFGLWRASTKDYRFEKLFAKTVSCLTWTERGLYACSRSAAGSFNLGLSKDLGASFEALQERQSVKAPIDCSAQSGFHQTCTAERWKTTYERDLGGRLPVNSSSASADAGASRADAAPSPATRGPCGCSVVGQPTNAAAALSALASFGVLWARQLQRKRRPRSPSGGRWK